MKRLFVARELEDTFSASSVGALINECLHMGWPLDPSVGRREVEEFLGTLGFDLDDTSRPIDLYAALNSVRQECWNGDSPLWSRYVESRRSNVERMSVPQHVSIGLTRTYHRAAVSSSRRARLPLPIAHPAQKDTAWTIRSSTVPVVETFEHPGALDVKMGGECSSFSIEVEYRASLTPQRPRPDEGKSDVPLTDVQSPFMDYQRISEKLYMLAEDTSLERKMRTLWNLFLQTLVSGHIHHSACTSKGCIQGVCFDCVTGSWSLAKCAETLGIPARVLSGVILNDFGPTPHFWCEVYLNGDWLPVDLYGWDLSDGDSGWTSRFFLSLECRLRFEMYPYAFSRFLPNIPWFIERRSFSGTTYVTYKCQRTGQLLAEDAWRLNFL